MRLPTNSIVSFRFGSIGAKKNPSIAPTTIIGMPIPIEICFEAIYVFDQNPSDFKVLFYI